MIDKQEEELIIKNAIEFLKRDNLIADINEKIISLDFCLNTYWGIYKIKLDNEKDCLLVYKEPRRYPIEISSDNKELYNLFNEKYNEITQKGAEMTREQENELIIKNAFEFLKRQDLRTLSCSINMPLLSKKQPKDYDIRHMMIWTELDNSKSLHIEYYIDFSWKLLSIPLDYNTELVNLFNETLSKLKEKNKLFLEELGKKINCNCENEHVSSKCAEPDKETYSDNDEHRDEEMLKACQQGLDLLDEMVEQSNTKQDADINIPNNGKYRRKSDGKIFFLISQHELKTTMNGITPSKEICEIVVDITKIYVLFSPALEGRYNHDILYVKENELNEDYEMLSED